MSDKHFREDNYLPCNRYEGHDINDQGFSLFLDPKKNEFYFAFLENNKVILRSEGYANASGRDNGVASVLKNMEDESRYKTRLLPNSKWILSLKAGNHQEIARSCPVNSESEALEFLPSARLKAKEQIRLTALANKAQAAKTFSSNLSDSNNDDYLTCKNYEGHDRLQEHADFSTFEHGGEFFFAMHDASGKVRLRSERYKSVAARNNGVQSVIKNRSNKDRLSIEEKRGIFYVVLKAGNHQEIARSCPYKTKEEADAFINPPVIAAAAPSPKRQDDDYLACKMYEGNERSAENPDFSTFTHEDEHYFAMLDADGKIKLRSEGYKSTKARDNGIASVTKNRAIKERFSIDEKMNYFFVVLKAGNHQEIGRSCPYKSHAEADAFINLPVVVAAAPKPKRKDDDYLACKMYEEHERSSENPDFSTFTHEDEHYFAMLDADGKIKLRSEGYKSTKARDNGIASVTKNRAIKERFSIEEKMNYFFVVLKAGNHQEIGRSCPYKSHAEADAFINPPVVVAAAPKPKRKDDDYLACKMYEGHERSTENPDFSTFTHEDEHYFAMLDADGKIKLRSEGYKSTKARDNGIASVTKNRAIKERFSVEEKMNYFFVVLKAGNHQEIGRSCPYKSHALADAFINPPVVVAAAPKPERKDDDYLACKKYKDHERSKANPDFSTFEQDGEFFFAMLDEEGEVKLRSERYQSAKARDNGIQSVIKNRSIEKRWSIDEKMGYYFSVLKAGNHQEIGRSCPHKDKPALGMWWLAAPAVALSAAAIPPKVEEPKKVLVQKEKEDDYLACKEYKNRFINDKQNQVALFKHENGQFYFTLYEDNGDVRLRSEGFRTAKERDQELKGVLKYKDDKSMYSRIERKGHYIDVLKDKTGREVGRSCLKKIAAPVVAAAPIAKKVIATTAVAAAATAATAASTVKTPAAKAAVASTASATQSGGFKWWWLLPLLLIPLLFFMWKGCNKAAVVAPPVVTEVAPAVATEKAAPPPVVTAPPPVAAAPTCDCAGQTHPVFNLPSTTAPKSLTALGRAPEFGNVHGLSTSEFYRKLKRAYKRSDNNKQFLDGIFKAMGYVGFKDATADLFSETTIQSGISANIGTGPNHKTVYRKLDLQGKDLKAFKIEAKNKCDLHFMKTCGNHMFYCSK